jgi:protein-S-isoprenylcysteine O-methyltransferase Ste14
MRIAGLATTVAGMPFAVWARVHLGRNWSSAPMIKKQHELVRSGPCRLVRHPIYTGLLLSAMGTFLVKGKVRGVLGVVLIYSGFAIRSRIKEEFKVRTFGSQYDDYRRTTGAIFPRVLN